MSASLDPKQVLQYSEKLPPLRDFFPVVDRSLLSLPLVKEWLADFPSYWAVDAGEKLKDFTHFPRLLEDLSHAYTEAEGRFADARPGVVALGGGTVGDFVGFVASVYRRGIPLCHIPSTWLAAVDSAHGGKTGLNLKGYKNQIGTFYPAQKVYLVKNLLLQQPQDLVQSAWGEWVKTALLGGGEFYQALKKLTLDPAHSASRLYDLLPEALAVKYQVIKEDPREQSGYRQILNPRP